MATLPQGEHSCREMKSTQSYDMFRSVVHPISEIKETLAMVHNITCNDPISDQPNPKMYDRPADEESDDEYSMYDRPADEESDDGRRLARAEGQDYDALSEEKKNEYVSRAMEAAGCLGHQEQGRRLATADGLQYDTLSDEKKKEHVSRAMQVAGHTANAASIVSRAGAARSLHDRMYDRVQK